MSSQLIAAVYRGPCDNEDKFGQPLRRGDIRDVTERDLLSAHWERVKPEKAAKPTTPATADTADGGDS